MFAIEQIAWLHSELAREREARQAAEQRADFEQSSRLTSEAQLGAQIENALRRAEAAEAKLAALEAQKPVAYQYRYSDPVSGMPVWRFSGGHWNGQRPRETQPLYARPVPAEVDESDLLELVEAGVKARLNERPDLAAENAALKQRIAALESVMANEPIDGCQFIFHQRVTKKSGSSWTGKIVGFYTTKLTPLGYCIESENEPGSVQNYPEAAIRALIKPEGDA